MWSGCAYTLAGMFTLIASRAGITCGYLLPARCRFTPMLDFFETAGFFATGDARFTFGFLLFFAFLEALLLALEDACVAPFSLSDSAKVKSAN